MRLARARARTTPPTSGEDDDDVLGVVLVLKIAGKDRCGEEIVGRDVEKALDLAGMEIEGQYAVGAGALDKVGDELGGDRCARSRFAVLSAYP